MNGASALIHSLTDVGITHVFGYPGGQAMRIFDELSHSDISCVLVRHEQGAVHAADGYARVSGKPGVVVVTSGPGATNTLTGIATAYMDSIPIIVITAQVPRNQVGTDSFQESDIFSMSMPVVKHSYLITDVSQVVPVVHEAYYLATSGRPGPVLIDIPSDILESVCDYDPRARYTLDSYKPTFKGNGKQIKRAAQVLKSSKKPVIIAGGGIRSLKALHSLDALCSTYALPVFTSLMGKGVVDESKNYALGPIGLHGSDTALEAIKACDVLLVCGCHLSNRVTGDTEIFISADTCVIHIDIDPAEIDKVLHADIPIVGDAGEVLTALIEELSLKDSEISDASFAENTTDKSNTSTLADITAVSTQNQNYHRMRSTWINDLQARKREEGFPKIPHIQPNTINPLTVMQNISDHITKTSSYVVTDVGQHQMWAMQAITITKHSKFITSGGLGTMGFGLPAALGIAYAHPQNEVICITGDGSIQMNIQEMASIVHAQLPIHVVLIDNNALGMVKQMQHAWYDDNFIATTFESNPDFVALAEAYGWQAECITKPDELTDALERMYETPTPYLLQICIASDTYVYPMHA